MRSGGMIRTDQPGVPATGRGLVPGPYRDRCGFGPADRRGADVGRGGQGPLADRGSGSVGRHGATSPFLLATRSPDCSRSRPLQLNAAVGRNQIRFTVLDAGLPFAGRTRRRQRTKACRTSRPASSTSRRRVPPSVCRPPRVRLSRNPSPPGHPGRRHFPLRSPGIVKRLSPSALRTLPVSLGDV